MTNTSQLFIMRDELYTEGLRDMIRYVNSFSPTSDMDMIEIGSYAGESTVIFAENFRTVTAIDPYLNDYDTDDITCQFMKLTDVYSVFLDATAKCTNISLLKETSDAAISVLQGQRFDVIYIDGMHTYAQIKKDINNYYQLVKPGGFICGHDYHHNYQGVVDGILETLGYPDKLFKDTSWIKRI